MWSEGVLALPGQTSVLQAGGRLQDHSQQTENQPIQILCHQHHPGNVLSRKQAHQPVGFLNNGVAVQSHSSHPSRRGTWRRRRSFSRSRHWSCRARPNGGIGSSCLLSPPPSRTPPSRHTSPASGPTLSWFHCTTSCLSSSSVCISFSWTTAVVLRVYHSISSPRCNAAI